MAKELPTLTSMHLPHDDLAHAAAPLVEAIERAEPLTGLMITGATGFVGKWLLASWLWAKRHTGLAAPALVLSRRPQAFLSQFPSLAQEDGLHFLSGDICDFSMPAWARVSHVIHAATSIADVVPPAEMIKVCVQGTQRALDAAILAGAERFLLLSSGAVYGECDPDVERFTERARSAPDCLLSSSAYGEGKRIAELLCSLCAAQTSLQVSIARCFAFVGPYIPMDRHFAIGNFIAAAEQGLPIRIKGDGTPVRSYLYAADLANALWTLLLRGPQRQAVNVGGEEAISMLGLAQRVAALLGSDSPIEIGSHAVSGAAPSRYVPDVSRLRELVGFRPRFTLDEAIIHTAQWWKTHGKHNR